MAKYRYGNVILPGLPGGVDAISCPCAFIIRSKETGRYILVRTRSVVYASAGDGSAGIVGIMIFPESNPGRAYRCTGSDLEWEIFPSLDGNLTSGTGIIVVEDTYYDLIWTNRDITDSLGYVYYRASEPVEVFDLEVWLIGFAMGLAGVPLPVDIPEEDE